VLPGPYSANWNPELRAWAYARQFIASYALADPITPLFAAINGNAALVVPDPAAANPLDVPKLITQVHMVLDASIDRADRASEILDQASGQGALHYWTGMLRIDRTKERNTFLLMLVARKIGEFVAMGLKDHYLMRRPAQVYPLIMPLIDGPDTPSFPSSHSLQAHMITGVLKLALPAPGPPPGPPPALYTTRQALDNLADRVAYNREVAGVHWRMDSEAGRFVAGLCVAQLAGLAAPFATLVANAVPELQFLPP
jgi:membrane-associated phospholipid phosphatase